MFKYFKLDEFDCPCCGKNWINPALIKTLDQVREELGLPIKITSGYRCKDHNKAVGGVAGSQHVLGEAADLFCSAMEELYRILPKYFQSIGDGRSKGFIHVDRRKESHRWVY